MSARSEARTRATARSWAEALAAGRLADTLDEAAFTLQTGRELGPARAVVVARGPEALARGLSALAMGETSWIDPAASAEERDLAARFSSGAGVDWAASWRRRPARISAPGPAWELGRYWLDGLPNGVTPTPTPPKPSAPTPIHQPADLVLSEDDPALADHRLDGRPLLPGALALACLFEAALKHQPGAILTDLIWLAPGLPTDGALRLRVDIEDSSSLVLRTAAGEALARARLAAEAPQSTIRRGDRTHRRLGPRRLALCALRRRGADLRADLPGGSHLTRGAHRGVGGAALRPVRALPRGGCRRRAAGRGGVWRLARQRAPRPAAALRGAGRAPAPALGRGGLCPPTRRRRAVLRRRSF
ncbi:MAG: polyketide synthase dehydratase domain-containing protein [Deltaproteobacteria bacterium]|nr:polyketide synthase dehydratase domain-containing protein [Deltaproteobacteria bacterium]